MLNNHKRVLLVEDDNNFGIVLRDFLLLHNYKVDLARNGLEGFEKFKNNEFDVCILDIMMPFKDGFTLAKEIRSNNKNVPIIFYPGDSIAIVYVFFFLIRLFFTFDIKINVT